MSDIIFGCHAVFHALKARRRRLLKVSLLREEGSLEQEAILRLAQENLVPIERSNKSFFACYTQFSHQGIIAEAEVYPFVNIDEIYREDLLLLCDGIQDPQNLGALCRTALLMGVGGVVLTEHGSVSITPAVCKAAAGAVEYLKLVTVSSLPKVINLLKENNFWIYGADSTASKSLYDEAFPEKVVLVIGGEGSGLSRLTKERCDILLKIPMPNPVLGSLNASVAGAIVLGEISRQKQQKSSRTS
ncbi:MAG: 23S rRNA (guanosine(2251)-2'-O)-methyltransferase RlmB [Deltaproteobacteria bacterium]|nr:23S rRNA (guanosine(2251)-2'-O)-methyltransferase RlmB [Deltaproteobacteria bacterium]